MTIVVNFFCGAGGGKSSMSTGVFSELKWLGVNAEYVPEYCKMMVWEERPAIFQNQNYIFGKQHYNIQRLIGKLDVVITDSPILLSAFYNNKTEENETFNQHVLNEFNKFDNINYFIERVKPYNPKGRFQTEEQAKQDDIYLKELLDKFGVSYQIIKGEKASTEIIANQIKSMVLTQKQAEAWKEK